MEKLYGGVDDVYYKMFLKLTSKIRNVYQAMLVRLDGDLG